MTTSSPILPSHVEETGQAIGNITAEHDQRATALQRTANHMTSILGHPAFISVLTAVLLLWILGNLGAMWIGYGPLDLPPFTWLQGAVAVSALYLTALILATQRHDDQLASHREQLILQLAMLSELKSTKIIQLLEEMRRDDPHMENRMDREAAAMSTPSDSKAVLDAIKEAHDETTGQRASSGTQVD